MEKEYRLTPQEAAAYLEVTEGTLSNWRAQDKSPTYYKLGGKVVYTKADLDEWIKGNRK
jgi:excisionase family DNA binding protein